MRLEYGGQKASSLERGISRFRMIPQVCGSLEAKRRLRNGIANHTTKPRSVTLPVEFHTVSNDGSKSWPSVHRASNCTPSKRVCYKGVGAAVVMERIEHDLDRVIVEDVL